MYRGGALPPKSLYSIYTAQGAQCNTSTTLYASYFPTITLRSPSFVFLLYNSSTQLQFERNNSTQLNMMQFSHNDLEGHIPNAGQLCNWMGFMIRTWD